MLKRQMTYGYNDVCIQPASISYVKHRSDCNTKKDGYHLPIFTAPMSSVVDERNYKIFSRNGIIPIIPRNIDLNKRYEYALLGDWVALSLNEFDEFINAHEVFTLPVRILIDVANGNMNQIFELSIKAKTKFGKDKIILMAGNIANPKTYIHYCKAGIDYVRATIGTGCGCITQSNVSIGYGVVNLLDEIYDIKRDIIQNDRNVACITKIIADGGIRNYSDVIKALALGADYVMIGGLFSGLIESCAKTYGYDKNNNLYVVDPLDGNTIVRETGGIFSIEHKNDNDDNCHIVDKLYKVFYGMASKRGQEDLFGEKKGTSEGIEKHLECTTNIDKWVKNMNDYLASAMSYCDIDDVEYFNPENVEVYLRSTNLQNSINK